MNESIKIEEQLQLGTFPVTTSPCVQNTQMNESIEIEDQFQLGTFPITKSPCVQNTEIDESIEIENQFQLRTSPVITSPCVQNDEVDDIKIEEEVLMETFPIPTSEEFNYDLLEVIKEVPVESEEYGYIEFNFNTGPKTVI
ncbi:uncharacterized protein LOC126264448 [Aethina tumida]|uniref:uncharacterized protein LOC126264448 n=1 Tax=Aethina tumida TaxID=116153 RepID=UPI002148E8D1|nr:uncharacterized protein LOC126264448 [Aethina tumida]